ncbi:hypothetical protein [Micromonospora sp. WMMD980]|uniref:DUF7224 domain-containing protein n=1 Tax=Micromonospora sp. WMMD980 TaxID=3016088 RepID=UPI002415A845|nr:hypothetical protein [Micromonospora sp. WMMD980]MDG4802779.1 hypothetical protein [Micromonospora sp. WMMD980]
MTEGFDAADFGRQFQQFMRAMSRLAPAPPPGPLFDRLERHLGRSPLDMPVVTATFPPHEHANVAIALDALTSARSEPASLIGVRSPGREYAGLGDIVDGAARHQYGLGATALCRHAGRTRRTRHRERTRGESHRARLCRGRQRCHEVTPMSRQILIEIRRSPLLWCAPVLIALELLLVFGRPGEWTTVWSQASARAQWPVLIVGPAVAAVATWSGGRTRRDGMREQLSRAARPAWTVELVRFAVVVLLGLLVYAAAPLAVLAIAAADGAPGRPWPGYLLLGAGTLVTCAAIGHLAGTRFSSRAAPPLAAITTFTALSWLQDDPRFALSVLSGHPQVAFAPAALGVRLALAGAATVAAVAGAAVLGRRAMRSGIRFERRLLAGGGVAALALVAAMPLTGPLRVGRPAPARPVCAGQQPQVCVWPEEQRHLADAVHASRRLAAAAVSAVPLPATLHEEGLTGTGPQSGFWVGYWDRAMVTSMISMVLPARWTCPTMATDQRRAWAENSVMLRTWLAVRVTGDDTLLDRTPPRVRDTVREVLGQDPLQQASWARARYQVVGDKTCAQ